jgi:hypothetical protein
LHRSPRDFGLDPSVWTLSLAARISFQQGLTPRLVSGESVRRALKRLGKSWNRAKHWITSPDPQYLLKKTLAIGCSAGPASRAVGREVAWQDKDQPVRLVEQPWQKDDPDPKAFACYGVLWQQGSVADPIRKQMSLRFVTGRPVSAMPIQFLCRFSDISALL